MAQAALKQDPGSDVDAAITELMERARAAMDAYQNQDQDRIDNAVSGGASATMIRADVNAEDHISAKVTPIRIERTSICGFLLR